MGVAAGRGMHAYARTYAYAGGDEVLKVATIDPGGTTGMVLYDQHKPSVSPAHVQLLSAKQEGRLEVIEVNCRNVLGGFRDILGVLDKFNPDVVVYEGFDLWTVAADLTPVELNALLRWEIGPDSGWSKSGKVKLVKQSPSERTVATSERLKRWGLWEPGKKDAMAAMQHMVVYLRKQHG